MALRQQWTAKVFSIGQRFRHLYEGGTATGGRYEVYLDLVVRGGREAGREIVLEMTTDEALDLAKRLRTRAAETAAYNKARGLI
jgi:hypothetical protein